MNTPQALRALQTLLEREEAARDEALSQLRRAEDLQRRAQAQAGELADYRAQYQQRWMARFRSYGAIEIVNCHNSFTQRLDEAVAQQQQQSDAAQQQADEARTQLQEMERRVAAVRKLIERRQAQQRIAALRREQKQNDESAQRMAWQGRKARAVAS